MGCCQPRRWSAAGTGTWPDSLAATRRSTSVRFAVGEHDPSDSNRAMSSMAGMSAATDVVDAAGSRLGVFRRTCGRSFQPAGRGCRRSGRGRLECLPSTASGRCSASRRSVVGRLGLADDELRVVVVAVLVECQVAMAFWALSTATSTWCRPYLRPAPCPGAACCWYCAERTTSRRSRPARGTAGSFRLRSCGCSRSPHPRTPRPSDPDEGHAWSRAITDRPCSWKITTSAPSRMRTSRPKASAYAEDFLIRRWPG